MKKRSLTVVVLAILAVIIGVIVIDFMNNRPDRRGDNPYALDVDEYKKVDENLISHKETRNFSLGTLTATGICYYNDRLFLVGDSSLVVISPDGSPVGMYEILPNPTCIETDGDNIFIGYLTHVAKYDTSGKLLQRWPDLGESTVITSLAIKDNRIYAADAGNRRVVIFSREGEIMGDFEGKAVTEAGHGFIIPSPNFDVVVNSYGELWVVNPGKHAIENYTDDGQMRGFWQNASYDIEGFLGCCNPAEITVKEDGSFITSEKGMVRIKIYDQSGTLLSVVASPNQFKEGGKAPEVCVDEQNIVYALDFDRNVVRVFELKGNG
ncbi:MAG: hypothetical protein KAR19_09110 [Bacteroidales bacterium]|nr:hypothetical protein [Bacteroidales bacterium]